MSILPKLTARQKQVLMLIQTSMNHTGAPPTRAEIAHVLGFASANAAEDHLRALQRKGLIELKPGTSRGIRLLPPALCVLTSVLQKQSTLPAGGVAQLCLPLVGRVAAGSPILAAEHIDCSYSVEPHLFDQKPDYLLVVRGMSMTGVGIFEGDFLAVQADCNAQDGQIVVARVGNDVTVKRLRMQRGYIELHPENPGYSVISVQSGDDFAIEGLVVGLIRRQLGA